MLKTHDARVYETYWEIIYHFCICVEYSGMRRQDFSHKTWANYLFCNLDHLLAIVSRYEVVNDETIKERIAS